MYTKLLALATYTGTIIGVGLFGLPYVTAKIGFGPTLIYFVILGTVMIVISLMYGEITLRTVENHRFPGYVSHYLNKHVAKITYLTTFIGLGGSLLAYIIIGGGFLANLLIPVFGGTTLLYSTIFFVLGAVIIYYGSGPVSKTEFFSLGLFFIVLFILFFRALPIIELNHFTTTDLAHFFLPYGVILFSIGGLAIIPELKELLLHREHAIKKIIIIGLLIPIVTYLLFIVTIVGVTGSATTPEAMIGFNLALGGGVAQLGFIFGIITTFTSFLTLGITLRKELQYDLKMPLPLAWVLACLPPFLFFLLGLKDFIGLIGFIGSIGLGIDITILAVMYFYARSKGERIPAYALRIGRGWVFVFSLMFLAGVILEIINVLGWL